MIIVMSLFSKTSVFKMFPCTRKRKLGFFKFLRSKERDGLVWTVGLTLAVKLHIAPALCARGLPFTKSFIKSLFFCVCIMLQAVFSCVFYFASVSLFSGFLMIG